MTKINFKKSGYMSDFFSYYCTLENERKTKFPIIFFCFYNYLTIKNL
jgi:hypothetical protein